VARWFIAVGLGAAALAGRGAGAAQTEKPVTFTRDIAPILASKCRPCHFEGGKVFAKLPFDRYDTVRTLGERLNTRLKDSDADLVTRWVKAGSLEK